MDEACFLFRFVYVENIKKQGISVSVVVPTYKRPQLLLRCIQALQQQDFFPPDYEIIVVSDGKDPSTGQALASISGNEFPLIRFYSLLRKGGPAAARNLGWQMAESDFIVFTDDDCIPDSGWLKAMWSAFEKPRQGEIEIAFSGKTFVPVGEVPTDYERNVAQLASAEFITANCACTKSALSNVGGFDERFKMAWREDSDLQFKFIEHAIPIVKVESAVVTHPVRKATWGICIKEESKGVFNALLYKKYPRLYKEKIEPDPPWRYYTIVLFLIVFVTGFFIGQTALAVTGLMGWLTMTVWFARKRLASTSHAWRHVSEMIFTSAVIPVVSLYWKFYGSWKYKVLLIP